MAVGTVRIDLHVVAGADAVWNVIGDFAAGPLRMAPGHVTGCVSRGDTRTVTFADGTVARERLVAVDHERRRIVYAVIGDTLRPQHDNASMQVLPVDETSCTLVWIHDVLPDDLALPMKSAMQAAGGVITAALGGR
jgi:hypothetical protein